MALKATHEQLRRHNRELLLRAVYGGMADSRAALAQLSGLTKPTVSSLIADLLEQGLVSEHGHGPSTDSGGKRPRLLRFEPDARQVIGVAVEGGRALAVLSNLAGRITARHIVELPAEVREASRPAERKELDAAVLDAVGGLRAQLDAPLLCVGVGVPAALAEHREAAASASVDGLRQALRQRFDVPAYLANTAELCALGQLAFGAEAGELAPGAESTPGTSVTLMIDQGVEVGVALDHGGYHYGTDISGLRSPADPAGSGGNLADGLRWRHTRRRVKELRASLPSGLPPDGLEYLHLHAAARRGDPVADTVLEELATALAPVLAWLTALLRPEQITIAGPIVDLGAPFLRRLDRHVTALSPGPDATRPRLLWAYAADLGSMGAVALALQAELGLL